MISPWLRFRLKLDRLLGVVGSVILAPLILVLALLVRRQDGGRALIAVPRIGRNGGVFRMWKIRSMRIEADDGRARGAPLTGSRDPRITPIGRVIRTLHLDELPQIYNVARGEMILLGPRPEAPEFVDPDSPDWNQVLATPPGIAGPTQIIVGDWEKTEIDRDSNGNAYQEHVVPVKLAIDRWYLHNASPGKDLLILGSLFLNALHRESSSLKKYVGESVPEATVAIEHRP